MPDTDETQYFKFRAWMLQPSATPKKQPADGLAGMQAMLEDALWAAWQAGYQEGQEQGAAMRVEMPSTTPNRGEP